MEFPGFTKEFVYNLINGFLISPFIPMKSNNCAISSTFHIIFNSNHVVHDMIHLMDRRPQPYQKNYVNLALNLSRTTCEYPFYFCLQTERERELIFIYIYIAFPDDNNQLRAMDISFNDVLELYKALFDFVEKSFVSLDAPNLLNNNKQIPKKLYDLFPSGGGRGEVGDFLDLNDAIDTLMFITHPNVSNKTEDANKETRHNHMDKFMVNNSYQYQCQCGFTYTDRKHDDEFSSFVPIYPLLQKS